MPDASGMDQYRTLLVGPDSPERQFLKNLLFERGHRLEICDTPDEARACIAHGNVALIVLAGVSPEALAFCRWIRSMVTPVCLVVAVDSMNALDSGPLTAAGVDDFLSTEDISDEMLSMRLDFLERRMRGGARRVEQALKDSEARTQSILETTEDGIITIDEKGSIESFNAAAERIFGWAENEVLGKNVSLLMPSPHAEDHQKYISRYLKTGKARIIGIGREVVGKHRDGHTFPLELSVSEVRLGGNRRIFTGIVRDVSERRRLEKEILRITDQERRRIGQDLHDGLGQMLTGIGLISQSLGRRLRNQGRQEAVDVEEITVLIKESDQFARTLARSLVPVDLEARGLVSALRRLAGNAERLFRIRCAFEEEGDASIHDETTASHLYRIAQEAVSNAVKHGHATEVTVGLSSKKDALRLWIKDDGSGFADDWRDHQGLGVRTMAYRARIIGATLDITTSPDGTPGTVITCTLQNATLLQSQP